MNETIVSTSSDFSNQDNFFSWNSLQDPLKWGATNGIQNLANIGVVVGGLAAVTLVSYGTVSASKFLSNKTIKLVHGINRKAGDWKAVRAEKKALMASVPPASPPAVETK